MSGSDGGWLAAETKARLSTSITWILAMLLVASVIGVVYIAVNPPETSEPFTEFYILGPDGEAAGYPSELRPGETGTVIIGISNHEHRSMAYRVAVKWNGTETQSRTVTVADEATREFRVNLSAPPQPARYRVRFLLFRPDRASDDPYRTLRLWIRVRAS